MPWIKIIELVTIFCSICAISGYLKNSIDDIVEDYSKCEELKKETDYYMYIDTDNQTEGYTFQVTAREDRQEWERFRNLPQEYR